MEARNEVLARIVEIVASVEKKELRAYFICFKFVFNKSYLIYRFMF